MSLPSEYRLALLKHEAFVYRKPMVFAFIGICIIGTIIGLLWPRHYVVSTTIVVDERNIIQPLMQGAAVATEVTDRARHARETIFGRRIMSQILVDTGLVQDNQPLSDQDALIKQVTDRTTITNVGRNLIRIDYQDSDPERAFNTTKRLAELFISESVAGKAAESQAAFEFIDKQSQEYQEKLTTAEEALKEFRSANVDAQPGSDADIATRLSGFQTRIEETARELREAEIRKTSLEKQLSGEAETASAITRESQYRARIAELTAQLETLRLSYHDTYPDIVRLRHQIGDLNQAIDAERQRRDDARAAGRPIIDESVVNNPMYQQLRRELSQTKVQIDTLSARMTQARQQMQLELERGKRVHGGAARLAELTRDYQVNREIYQDLLRRRENARVSMNLDKENQGLTFRIQEPAREPTAPSGPRFWHFMLGGMVLGLVIPLGLIYAKLQFDSKIRIAPLVTERLGIPMLAAVPHFWFPQETTAARRETHRLSAALAGTAVLLIAVGIVKFAKVF